MEEQQLEHVLPSAPVGVELMHVWKGCKCMGGDRRGSKIPAPLTLLACQDLWLPLCAHAQQAQVGLVW